jgi:nucleoside-diphosphate-sugar epimerase
MTRTIVITGAASGIGLVTATRLSTDAEVRLCLVDSDRDTLNSLELNDRHLRIPADVTTPGWFDDCSHVMGIFPNDKGYAKAHLTTQPYPLRNTKSRPAVVYYVKTYRLRGRNAGCHRKRR